MNVLVSAYACEPGLGSEASVGWNVAVEASRHDRVWVVTRSNNRPSIEAALAASPEPGLRFIYVDLPKWARAWKRGPRGVQLYYYLWQLAAVGTLRRCHRRIGFDVAHHVTFAKYWAPSALAFLPIPYVWGPVGGAESTPPRFLEAMSLPGRVFERTRAIARWIAERDPLVRRTARRSAVAVGAGPETAERLRALGARRVLERSQIGLSKTEFDRLGLPSGRRPGPARFASVGRLVPLKGFDLGLRAFGALPTGDAEMWFFGEGPERRKLERLARELGVAPRVRFWGWLPRRDVMRRLAECDVLVHPSLHDSGGLACLEAMAASKPVVCLALGGPALQVTPETGAVVPARDPQQATRDLAAAMTRLSVDSGLRERQGYAARRRAADAFRYDRRAREFAALYASVAGRGNGRP